MRSCSDLSLSPRSVLGPEPRAQVLQEVIEIQEFKTREYNPSFVLMEYFGYLRRDPDQGGYDFWLNVINNRLPNNYINCSHG